jgi:hypothetical protein
VANVKIIQGAVLMALSQTDGLEIMQKITRLKSEQIAIFKVNNLSSPHARLGSRQPTNYISAHAQW